MYNIIALMGEAGSGKDRTLKEVLAAAPFLNEIISCTTRPARQGEQHGVNYYYYSVDDFKQKIDNNEMLEHTIFNNWYYGTSTDSVDETKVNIGVFNPAGVRSLLNRNDCNVLVFWIKTDDKTRLLRQLNRENDPDVREVVRRFQADYDDFDKIEYNFISLPNDHVDDLGWNVEEILSQVESKFAQGQT